MEVEFTLKPEDFLAFNRYQSKPLLVSIFILSVFIIASIGLTGMFIAFRSLEASGREGDPALFAGMLAGTIGASFGFFLWQRWLHWIMFKETCTDLRSEWTTRDIRVILSPEHLRTLSRFSMGTYSWSVVWRIAVTRYHTFLYITKRTAFIIPRRAFRDAQHFDEFIGLAKQYQHGLSQKPIGIVTSLPPAPTAFINRDEQ